MLQSIFQQCPELRPLGQWAAARRVSITAMPGAAAAVSADAVRLRFTSLDVAAEITVFDEYGDARHDDLMLCLLLIQREFWELEDHDFAGWAKANGLAAGPAEEQIYNQNRTAARAITGALGEIPDVIGPMDWQLNAGAVQVLRKRQS